MSTSKSDDHVLPAFSKAGVSASRNIRILAAQLRARGFHVMNVTEGDDCVEYAEISLSEKVHVVVAVEDLSRPYLCARNPEDEDTFEFGEPRSSLDDLVADIEACGIRRAATVADLTEAQRECLADSNRRADADRMLDDLRDRCGMNVDALRATLSKRGRFWEILRSYTKMQEWLTGGGRVAMRHQIDDGSYLLITDTDDANIPDDDAEKVLVGRYDDAGPIALTRSRLGEDSGERLEVDVANLEAFIDEVLADGRDPERQDDEQARLCSEWNQFCKCEGISDGADAEEILITRLDSLSRAAQTYVSRFIKRWDALMQRQQKLYELLVRYQTVPESAGVAASVVSAYFISKLGVDPADASLAELPVDSEYGAECVKAIDAAAALLEHVRGILRNSRPDLIAHIVVTARAVVRVCWRGWKCIPRGHSEKMTLAQIRAMFQVGQVWDAVNTFRGGANGPRKLLKIETKNLIWSNETAPQFWMPFPKASDVIEARDGYLSFKLVVGDREGTVTLTRRPVEQKTEMFYVMHEVDGDDCLLHTRDKFADAMTAAEEEAKRDPRAQLSIMSTTRGLLVLPGEDGKPVFTKAVTGEERAEVTKDT